MTSRRLLPLASLALLVLLLTGCDLPWPLNKLSGQRQVPPQQPVYVASIITRDMLQRDSVVFAVEPQASTFYEGEVALFVLNKWSGLAIGDHTEAAVVSTAAGQELARESATFTITADDLTATLTEPFQFENLPPGRYWVSIELDGVEQVRYQFQVVER